MQPSGAVSLGEIWSFFIHGGPRGSPRFPGCPQSVPGRIGAPEESRGCLPQGNICSFYQAPHGQKRNTSFQITMVSFHIVKFSLFTRLQTSKKKTNHTTDSRRRHDQFENDMLGSSTIIFGSKTCDPSGHLWGLPRDLGGNDARSF